MTKRSSSTLAILLVTLVSLPAWLHAWAEPAIRQEPMVEEEPRAAEPMAEEEPMTEEEPIAEEEPMAEEGPVVLMSGVWAQRACEAWNRSEDLTAGLAKWVQNHKGRGYKIIQLYRNDCEESAWVEFKLEPADDCARCVFGGELQTEELDPGADYVMNASTERWQEMGEGRYGPMRGMLTGRLSFKGPRWEAMRNMGPFASFLLLVGEVPGEADACP